MSDQANREAFLEGMSLLREMPVNDKQDILDLLEIFMTSTIEVEVEGARDGIQEIVLDEPVRLKRLV